MVNTWVFKSKLRVCLISIPWHLPTVAHCTSGSFVIWHSKLLSGGDPPGDMSRWDWTENRHLQRPHLQDPALWMSNLAADILGLLDKPSTSVNDWIDWIMNQCHSTWVASFTLYALSTVHSGCGRTVTHWIRLLIEKRNKEKNPKRTNLLLQVDSLLLFTLLP